MRSYYVLFLYLFCFPIILSFPSPSPAVAADVDDTSAAYLLSIEFNDNLLSVQAENIPFEEVLNGLSMETGAEFTVRDPGLLQEPVSVSFTGLSFSDAAARLLKNYNYLLEYGDDDRASVIIFASKGSGGAVPGDYTISGQETIAHKKPQSLDECQGLDFTEDDMSSKQLGNRHKDAGLYRQMLEADRAALNDAKIARAKKVLGIERCAHLWESAVRSLTKIQDDRVTSLLSETAKNGKNLPLKDAAAEALWHNTAESEFKNMKGVNALRELTTSPNEGVRQSAQSALKDYENYLKSTQSSDH